MGKKRFERLNKINFDLLLICEIMRTSRLLVLKNSLMCPFSLEKYFHFKVPGLLHLPATLLGYVATGKALIFLNKLVCQK